MEDIPENNQQHDDLPSIVVLRRYHEMTPSEAGMEDHELQEILEKENLDVEKFLEQGVNKGVDSLSQEEFDNIQQLFLWRSQSKSSRVKRNNDNKENVGIKTMEETQGHSSKNLGRKRGRKRHNELLIECGKLMINSGKIKDLISYSFTNLY